MADTLLRTLVLLQYYLLNNLCLTKYLETLFLEG
ncbi:rCG26416 [Rattus norvegicus]|uniref:RCG26416 n=1 Tax=Rattus norvegicus TaxID=10116 RepID=A6HPG8_RAT|nr:rCG26416 [Rattus norvegicus]